MAEYICEDVALHNKSNKSSGSKQPVKSYGSDGKWGTKNQIYTALDRLSSCTCGFTVYVTWTMGSLSITRYFTFEHCALLHHLLCINSFLFGFISCCFWRLATLLATSVAPVLFFIYTRWHLINHTISLGVSMVLISRGYTPSLCVSSNGSVTFIHINLL